MVFKTFNLLPNLFQKYGPIKEMPFWTKLLFFKGISRAICNLVLYVLLKGTKISFIQNGEVSFQYLKTFLVMRCSVLSFVDNNFICLISLASACSFEFSFKQNRVHLFWVACNLFLIFWLIKGYQEKQALSKCDWIKELHSNLRNFGFKNPFWLYNNCNFNCNCKLYWSS